MLGISKEIFQLPQEKSELLLPFVLFLMSVVLGTRVFHRFFDESGEKSPWISRVVLSIALTLIGASLVYEPPARYPDLWHGFGVGVALVAFLVAGCWCLITPHDSVIRRMRPLVKVLTLSLLVGVYIPALIQPPWGFINLGDASHQVLEEISGVLVGHFPGVNFVSTYTTLLGTPLLLLRPLAVSSSVEMFLVVLWVNILTLLVPALMTLLARRSLGLRSVAVPALLVIAPLMISGNWGSASSNVESLSMIPGRTLLPLWLGLLVTSAVKRDSQKAWFVVGLCCLATSYNNIEFGVPAVCSVILVLLFLGPLSKVVRAAKAVLGGLVFGAFLVFTYSLFVAGPLDLWYRIGSYSGRPYSPSNPFPLWSTHNLLLALFVMAVILGLRERRNTIHASTVAIYFGAWGLLSFPYCSYRCESELYMSTQVYLIPAIVCSVAIAGIYLQGRRSNPSHQDRRRQNPIVSLLIGISIAAILQAPNPIDEWRRIGGGAESMPWAQDSDRALPNEWSSEKVDWIDVKTLKNLRKEFGASEIGYFGHMGNSVQLATRMNNLTRINSSEVLQIKGTRRLMELACREVDEIHPKFIVVVGIDFPCDGYDPIPPLKNYPRLQVYRSDKSDLFQD